MRKFIIISCIAGSAFITLAQCGFFEALLAFFVAGAVPGTSYSIPSNVMYGILIAAMSLTVVRLIGPTILDIIYTFTDKNSPKKKTKSKLPKRRYGQI